MGIVNIQNLLKQKKEAKRALAKELGFKAGQPLVLMVMEGKVGAKLRSEMEAILEAFGQIDATLLMVGDEEIGVDRGGDAKMVNVAWMAYGMENRSKAMEAADMAIAFDFNDVEEMLLNGTVPVSGVRKEVENYDAISEKGNAFLWGGAGAKPGRWAIFAALVRALETRKFPYDWANIVRVGVKGVEA